MEEENFDIHWLNERYPFDAEARNKALEGKVLSFLKDIETLYLVDAGAGTGSNCLYFLEKLPQNQYWYLIEQNASLQNATIRRFSDFANYHNYKFLRKKDELFISKPRKEITIKIINDSVFRLPAFIDLPKIHLITANALFDLFTITQIDNFAQILFEHKIPIYTTLSYESMQFSPQDPFDSIFIEQYNNHMERTQPFGKALGKRAGIYFANIFSQNNWTASTQSSTWNIKPDDIKMHYYLLNFMENALEELPLEANVQENFQKWVMRKKNLIIARQQSLTIKHLDLFASPSY